MNEKTKIILLIAIVSGTSFLILFKLSQAYARAR